MFFTEISIEKHFEEVFFLLTETGLLTADQTEKVNELIEKLVQHNICDDEDVMNTIQKCRVAMYFSGTTQADFLADSRKQISGKLRCRFEFENNKKKRKQ